MCEIVNRLPLNSKFNEHFWGHNGFDELRRYIKSGGEFCKELAVVMHERAELEASYAKGLHKLSSKLVKASRDSLGTVSEAWQTVGAELQHEGDVHRILASTITEELVRPLRTLIETQHKIRKGVETIVDKTTKNLYDWKTAEAKSKKNSFHNNRENEKVQQMAMEARLGKGKLLSERDFFKLEKQKKKAEDAVEKSNLEYYTFSIKTERARQEWESAIYKGSNCFQTLEEERLAGLKDLVEKYYSNIKEIAPKIASTYERLKEPVDNCDVAKDIANIIAVKGTGQNNPEQQLPDFYAEDFNTVMNTSRRKESLEKFNKMIRTDLEREKRGKQGIENLAKALQETPNFGGEDSQQDVNDKLQHMKAMLAYLEASRYKIQRSLDELLSKPRNYHPLARHIETCRDKQGILVSILKVPPWVRNDGGSDICSLSNSPEILPDWNDRGTADGTSMQPESDFAKEDTPTSFMFPSRYPSLTLPTDEFSSQGSDHEYLNTLNAQNDVCSTEDPNGDIDKSQDVPDGTYYAQPLTAVQASGRCKALYDYEANMYDELSIKTGDIINIHEKQPDGWWVGELEGIVGIFPATYVEEIDFTN